MDDAVGKSYRLYAFFQEHENEVASVSFDGLRLATASRDSVWIWEYYGGTGFDFAEDLIGHTENVQMVLWHPRKDILFSCGCDDSIMV